MLQFLVMPQLVRRKTLVSATFTNMIPYIFVDLVNVSLELTHILPTLITLFLGLLVHPSYVFRDEGTTKYFLA